MIRHLFAPLAMLAILCAPSGAQDCTYRALPTVDRAKVSAISGDSAAAKRWIAQAETECATSAGVMRKIAEVYELLGDKTMAALYAGQAQRLSPGVIFVQPGDRGAEPIPGRQAIDDKSFVREKWALIVGVGRFQQAGIPTLAYAVKDAQDFAVVLADPNVGRFRDDGEHIQLLTDEKATVGNIRSSINRIARNARAEDLVVLYFSSHGSSAEQDFATERAQTGYVVAHDTRTDDLYATAFPMKELQQVVDDRFKAARVVTFLDTCYSGDTLRRPGAGGKSLSVGIPPDSVARIAQGKGRVVIASSRSNERSWESDVYKNSYFTHYLLEAMRKTDGKATVTQLFTYLQRFVPPAVRKEKNESQNPLMHPEGREISVVIGTVIE